MGYIIQCGDGYVTRKQNGTPYIISDKTKALVISTEEKANNIMISLLKLMREKGLQLLYEGDNSDDDKTVINNQYTKVDMDNVKTLVCDLSDQFKIMQGNKDWLIDMESKIDQEISDILHYIEFYSFSACDGYKLAKELKELRLKRRDIKNQLQAINIIKTHTCNMLTDGRTNKALCSIDNKQYTPRILTELFEQKEKKTN